jgi:hypothetical protein
MDNWKGVTINCAAQLTAEHIKNGAKLLEAIHFVPHCWMCGNTNIKFVGKARYICNDPDCIKTREWLESPEGKKALASII